MERDIGELYDKYYSYLYKYALSLTANEEEAKDLVADTFVRVILKIGSFRGNSSVETWMASILKNLWYSRLRRGRDEPLPDEDRADSGTSVEDAVLGDADSALGERARRAVEALAEPYRSVFVSRAVDGKPISEVAAETGHTETWVRVTCFRARQKLIEMMKEETE